MDWTVMLWMAAIPIAGYFLFMMVLGKNTPRQPWQETAAYVAYGLMAVWLLAVVVTAFMT